MNALLLDTDVIIDILRNKEKTIEQISSLIPGKMLCCSCISVGEIFAGMHKKEEVLTRQLLDSLIKIPVTEEIAERAGRLKYTIKSHALQLDDCLIGATALANNLMLLTKNSKHYPFANLAVQKII